MLRPIAESRAPMTNDLTVHVNLQDRSYDIVITSNRLAETGASIQGWFAQRYAGHAGTRKALVVADQNSAIYGGVVGSSLEACGWVVKPARVAAGEPSKSLEMLGRLLDQMVEFKADRQTLVVAVGGGVMGDLAGFVAATYARGVPFVQVPTTLLADVDSSVGGKVGINHAAAKNMIGAFHQPLGVFIDTDVLRTLSDREYRAGLAEIIKYGVILDAEFFGYLEAHVEGINQREPAVLRHMIARSCQLKANVVEHDEFERTGLRAVLNYGHTFGHAFEALSGYGELLHGEAVAIGMPYASRLAERLGRIDSSVTARQEALLEAVGLPIRLSAASHFSTDAVLDKMRLDKKTVGGQLRFVLPTRMGHVETVKDVSELLVREVLES